MHSKTVEGNIHETRYPQENMMYLLISMASCPFPHFLCLIAPIIQVCYTLQECQKKTLSPRVWERERENNERAPKLNWQKVTHWSSEALLWMRPLFSSFSIIFLHFTPHMKPVTFHLLFLLISIISINKCAKNDIFPFQSLIHFLFQFP